jgi:hypothetical protein
VVEQGTHKSLTASAVLRAWERVRKFQSYRLKLRPLERCATGLLTLAPCERWVFSYLLKRVEPHKRHLPCRRARFLAVCHRRREPKGAGVAKGARIQQAQERLAARQVRAPKPCALAQAITRTELSMDPLSRPVQGLGAPHPLRAGGLIER